MLLAQLIATYRRPHAHHTRLAQVRPLSAPVVHLAEMLQLDAKLIKARAANLMADAKAGERSDILHSRWDEELDKLNAEQQREEARLASQLAAHQQAGRSAKSRYSTEYPLSMWHECTAPVREK